MLIRLLGAMDILSGIFLIMSHFGLTKYLAFIFIIYLVLKGLIFLPDPASIGDIIIGFYMAIVVLGLHISITFVVSLYLIIKGIACYINFS